MRRTIVVSLTALIFGLATVPHGIGQVTTARLEGLVRDATGAIIPGVNVTATQTGTNIESQAVTNEIGLYVFPRLTPGTYTITAELPGFKRAMYPGIHLEVGDTA